MPRPMACIYHFDVIALNQKSPDSYFVCQDPSKIKISFPLLATIRLNLQKVEMEILKVGDRNDGF